MTSGSRSPLTKETTRYGFIPEYSQDRTTDTMTLSRLCSFSYQWTLCERYFETEVRLALWRSVISCDTNFTTLLVV